MIGCFKVGPDYVRPEVPVNKDWNTQFGGQRAPKEAAVKTLAVWWTTLNDPKLSELIERATAGNLDLKQAKARVREARALSGVAKSDLFPTIDMTGNASRNKSSEEVGSSATTNLYNIGLDAAWELDIFGGVHRSVEAAEANLQASQEDWRDVLVSLLAEVALNYVDVRTYQVRLTVAEDNLKSQSETYQLTQWRNEAGLSDEVAVQQARYNLENTRSQIPVLRTGLEVALNRIAVLLGEKPEKVHAELAQREAIPVPPPNAVVGVPADILRRRPDIRKAERDLAEQTAKVGVAISDLYPKFKLNGSIGLEAFSTGNLFSSGSRFNSFGPSISLPIFAGGAIRKNIEVQSALQEQYLIAYETTILSALEEVENALFTYKEAQQRRQTLIDATHAAQKAAELAWFRYEAGLTDFTDVLEAQRSLLSFQEQLAQSCGNITADLIRIYKALGGGWASSTDDI